MALFSRANGVVLGLTLLIAGWWFVRNQLLYGDLTGFGAVTELWGVRDPWKSFDVAWYEIPHAWSSLWGRFGFGQIPLPEPVYDVLAWLAAAGGIGFLIGAGRLGIHRGRPASGLFLLALTVLASFAVLYAYMLVSPAGSMGRFFFPGLPALVGVVFFGWWELVRLALSSLRMILRQDKDDLALPAVALLRIGE